VGLRMSRRLRDCHQGGVLQCRHRGPLAARRADVWFTGDDEAGGVNVLASSVLPE
jgi:hypothetical protein